jgi:hypothetical protein
MGLPLSGSPLGGANKRRTFALTSDFVSQRTIGVATGTFQKASLASERKAHPLDQIDVARVGAKRLQCLGYFDELQSLRLFGICLFQPEKGLLLFAENGAFVAYNRWVYIAALSHLLEKFNMATLRRAEAALGVYSRHLFGNGQLVWIVCQSSTLFPFIQPHVELTQFIVEARKIIVHRSVVWINIESLFVLIQRPIILAFILIDSCKTRVKS